MADPAKKIATYADIEALPLHVTGEILYGTLVTHPRPFPVHARAQSSLSYELEGPFNRGKGGPGGWTFMIEPQLKLGPHVVVPDLAGWKTERITPFPVAASVDIAPDWICEILSESTERFDRTTKRRIYGEFGVQYLWLLDPRFRILECFTLVSGNWLLARTFDIDSQVSAPPFEETSFDLAALFPAADFSKPSE
jgi:Uma2 family endonuclease